MKWLKDHQIRQKNDKVVVEAGDDPDWVYDQYKEQKLRQIKHEDAERQDRRMRRNKRVLKCRKRSKGNVSFSCLCLSSEKR